MLLAKQIKHKPGHINAKIVSKRTKRNEWLTILREAVIGGSTFYFMVQAFHVGQINPTDASGSSHVFSLVVCAVYYGLYAFDSFDKEDVIVLADTVSEEDWEAQEISTNLYRIERKDGGSLRKTFYSLMLVITTAFLAYTIYFGWR